MNSPTISRKDLLIAVGALAAAVALPKISSAQAATEQAPAHPEITVDDLKSAQKLVGLSFTDGQLKEMLQDVRDTLSGYEDVRKEPLGNGTEMATVFVPFNTRPDKRRPGMSAKLSSRAVAHASTEDDLAFAPLSDLANLLRTQQITSAHLTEMYLGRLQKYGDKLVAVVTLLADQARVDAARADKQIKGGKYRGPLHGIPTGVKDLFSYAGAPTTWGAAIYKNQMFDYDSAVVEKLKAAGAVICAKTTCGALANGDQWFGGQTKNPWNPSQGSSGSSAGSAACVSAGLLPYAIGTETQGSVVSPSHQCRVTGLRPTFGRTSRFGGMTLCWTMDKVGVLARCAEDTAFVLAAIAGADYRDRSSVDRPFHYAPKVDIGGLKIGFLLDPKEDPATTTKPQTMEILKVLAKLGAKDVRPISITRALDGIDNILVVESAAAFDDITRTGQVDDIKNSSWPETFRATRFFTGVELVQAYRARMLLMQRIEIELGDIDILVTGSRGGGMIATTNLTGHPQLLLPWGADAKGNSNSYSLIGRLYEEDTLIAVANAIQSETDFHKRRPDLSKL
jgi:Asp-tRNA(Asn)/Glu-tRNA(Gln) amidotransferase A subunit family amidase